MMEKSTSVEMSAMGATEPEICAIFDLEAFLAEEPRSVGHVRDGVGHRARRMADPNFLFLGFALSKRGRFNPDADREASRR